MAIFKERIFSVITYGTTDLIGRLFKLLFLPLLAWLIEPGEYGKISLFISFSVFAAILVSFNLTNYIRHITLTRENELVSYLSTIYITTVTLGLIFIIPFSWNSYLIKLILYSSCISIQIGAASYYLALGKKHHYFVFTSIVNFVGYAIPLVLIFLKQKEDFISILSSVLTFQIITTIGVLLFLFIKGLVRLNKFSKIILVELVQLNTPLVVNSLAGVGLIYIDRVFIEHYHGFNELGQYTFIYNSYLIYGLLTQAIVSDFIPKFYSELNKKRKEIALKMLPSYHQFGALFIPLGLLLILFLEHYKPNQYYIDTNAYIILNLSAIFQFFYSLNVNKLHYFEKTGKILKATLFAFTVNLILNAILIPEMSQKGAALATLFGYLSLYYFVYRYSKDV